MTQTNVIFIEDALHGIELLQIPALTCIMNWQIGPQANITLDISLQETGQSQLVKHQFMAEMNLVMTKRNSGSSYHKIISEGELKQVEQM